MSCKVKVISERTVCLQQSNGPSPPLTHSTPFVTLEIVAAWWHHWAPESVLFQAFATDASGAWLWWRGVFHVCGTCGGGGGGGAGGRRGQLGQTWSSHQLPPVTSAPSPAPLPEPMLPCAPAIALIHRRAGAEKHQESEKSATHWQLWKH